MIKWIIDHWKVWRLKRAKQAEIKLIETARYECMKHKDQMPNFEEILEQIEDDNEVYSCEAWSHHHPFANFSSPDSVRFKKIVTGSVNAYYVARYLALQLDYYYDGYRGIKFEITKLKNNEQ